ncbi:unnamed protein product [Camellia sinensis]
MEPPGLTEGLTNSKQESIIGTQNGSDLFNEMKHQFLSFKRQKFLENLECYENLAKSQAPKNGPTETNAALEFAVNSLEVENILVIGHSCCGGICTLMSMQDDVNSRFGQFQSFLFFISLSLLHMRASKQASAHYTRNHLIFFFFFQFQGSCELSVLQR